MKILVNVGVENKGINNKKKSQSERRAPRATRRHGVLSSGCKVLVGTPWWGSYLRTSMGVLQRGTPWSGNGESGGEKRGTACSARSVRPRPSSGWPCSFRSEAALPPTRIFRTIRHTTQCFPPKRKCSAQCSLSHPPSHSLDPFRLSLSLSIALHSSIERVMSSSASSTSTSSSSYE